MNTLLLTRSEIEHLVDTPTLDALLRDAFRNYSLERAIPGNRYFSELAAPGAMMILAPGLATGIPAYSVKVHAKYPAEQPGIRGALLLNDLQTGALLAVMDSTYLTAVRTGLSAAIATDILARQDASRVAVIGAGTQARFLLRYLYRYRQIKQVCVYDTSIENAESFVTQMRAELGVDIECSVSLPSATRNSDILLLATWSVEPFLTPDLVSSGCHITTLGADQPGEAEVTAELIRDALFVCDDRNLAISMGAIGGATLDAHWIDAELGEVIAGTKPGRRSANEITIYGAVGVAFQDLVTAWHVYEAAKLNHVGRWIDFLG